MAGELKRVERARKVERGQGRETLSLRLKVTLLDSLLFRESRKIHRKRQRTAVFLYGFGGNKAGESLTAVIPI